MGHGPCAAGRNSLVKSRSQNTGQCRRALYRMPTPASAIWHWALVPYVTLPGYTAIRAVRMPVCCWRWTCITHLVGEQGATGIQSRPAIWKPSLPCATCLLSTSPLPSSPFLSYSSLSICASCASWDVVKQLLRNCGEMSHYPEIEGGVHSISNPSLNPREWYDVPGSNMDCQPGSKVRDLIP